MIALLGVAFASATSSATAVLSPDDGTLGLGEAVYLEAVGDASCGAIEVQDEAAAGVPFTCVVLASDGRVLQLLPEPTWPAGELTVVVGGGSVLLTAEDLVASDASTAVPIDRAVTSVGVSFRVCRDGVVSQVARSDSEPGDGEGVVLVQANEVAWFGAADASWPEAAPGETGTFWFRTWGADGLPSAWSSDEVELIDDGLVRTDLRFGADLENGICPGPDEPWVLGEEEKAAGEPIPDPKDEGEEKRGCGGGSRAWFALPLFLLFRRRPYQPSMPK